VRTSTWVLCATLLASAAPASADTCDPAPLRARLEKEQSRATIWRWGWAAGFGASAAGQLALSYVVDDPDQQLGLRASAAKATVGFLARVVIPLRVVVPIKYNDPCEELKSLRLAIEKAGKKERNSFWLNHVGGLAVNGAAAVYLVYAASSSKTALLSMVIGSPVGWISTYTMPRWAWREWRDFDATVTVTPRPEGGAMIGVMGSF